MRIATMYARTAAIGAAILAFLPAAGALAAPHDNRPKILLHVRPTTTKNACGLNGWGSLTNCQDAVVSAASSPGGASYYVYLLAARGNLADLAGLQCGITYQNGCPSAMSDGVGVDIYSWTLCTGGLEFPAPGESAWPRPGGSNLITWDSSTACQTGDASVAGYFYVGAYGQDYLRVIPRPVDGLAKVATCQSTETILSDYLDLGYVAFSPSAANWGCNPCTPNCPIVDIFPGAPQAPSVTIHLRPADQGATCVAGAVPCSQVVTAADITTQTHWYAYLLADGGTDSRPVDGVEVGITYQGNEPLGARDMTGLDILSWTRCATADVPTVGERAWPGPGSGNVISWDGAAMATAGSRRVAGYFYVSAYSADLLRVVPHPVTQAIQLDRCVGEPTPVSIFRAGSAAFGDGTGGCNPCLSACDEGVPVERKSWSGIKTLVRE